MISLLVESQKNGKAVILKIKGEERSFISAVEHVDETTANFTTKPCTIYGKLLQRVNFNIEEVESVRLLDTHFDDDFYFYLRVVKKNIEEIQHRSRMIQAKTNSLSGPYALREIR